MVALDFDLVDLVVGQGRLEGQDTIWIVDGLVAVASTAATATAIVAPTTAVASTAVVVASVLTMHLESDLYARAKRNLI